jgi:hypothetical protein
MRGDGTCAELSRSTAAFRAGRSCTVLFHHSSRGGGAALGRLPRRYSQTELGTTVEQKVLEKLREMPSESKKRITAIRHAGTLTPQLPRPPPRCRLSSSPPDSAQPAHQ